MFNNTARVQSLRVAIATPAFVKGGDGQGRVNYEIALRAAEAGHEVTLVATRIDDDVERDERFRCVRVWGERLPADILKTQIASYLSRGWLRAHRSEFDVIHGNGSFALIDSDVNTAHFVHAAWLRSPVHTSRLKTGMPSLYSASVTRFHRFEESIAYRNAGIVVAISDVTRQELIDSGVSADKLRVIRNGVDTAEFHPGPADRRELGLPPDRFLALFAGDITTPRKNLDTVLRALQSLENVHLVVLGSPKRSPYPAMAREIGVGERVTFLGFRRDVAQIMRAVDVFVFPSRYESCSLVLLEALASGLPVVTARTAGGAEIVAEAGGTVLNDPNDVAGVASAVRALAGDPALAKNRGASSREVALRHGWRTMADAYLDLYAQAAQRHRRPNGPL
jgi:glycosyltransferase involved in cell wall biosynthesis